MEGIEQKVQSVCLKNTFFNPKIKYEAMLLHISEHWLHVLVLYTKELHATIFKSKL